MPPRPILKYPVRKETGKSLRTTRAKHREDVLLDRIAAQQSREIKIAPLPRDLRREGAKRNRVKIIEAIREGLGEAWTL